MLITLNQLKTSLLAFKDWVLARIPSKTSDLTNDSDFVTTADIPTKVSDLVDDSGHYTKPSSGIPASDLASGAVPVQDVTVNGTSVVSNKIAKIVLEDKFIWNMLVGTANPDVSSADKYPHIDGQVANTEVTGIISTAEHGVRITKDEYGGLSINFGNGDSAFGLEPGTYTLSFDLWMKATTTFYGSLPHLTLTYEAGSQYKDVSTRDLTQAELGNDVNIGTASITFTVNKYKYPRLSITTIYPDCFENGGYIELRNLMLNKGDGVLPWSPSLSEVMVEPPVQDVQINGTSIVTDGVANVPIAEKGVDAVRVLGLVSAKNPDVSGINISDGLLSIYKANESDTKQGIQTVRPITPSNQHQSVFYGLAKAAGDTTQSASSNAVGIYTDEAKSAIRSMLDVPEIDSKAPVIVETASGAVASFDDGANDLPVKGLSVAVEPIQDLHGYDSPWPAGGGVNLLPPYSQASAISNGITLTNENGKYTLNGMATARASFDIPVSIPTGTYTLSAFNSPLSGSSIYVMDTSYNVLVNIAITGEGKTHSFTVSTDIAYIRITVGANNTLSNGTLLPVIVTGSTAPASFSPYENICPITGWTGAKVTRTGKNLVPVSYQSAGGTISGITFTPHEDGSITIDGTATANAIYYIRSAKTALSLKAGTYTLKGIPNGSSNTLSFRVYTADGSIGYARAADYTFTLEQSEIVSLSLYVYKGYTVNNEVIKPMLVYGSAATDYEPYQGETYDITFPTEAGTVYGGNLDVTTGVLTVDRAKVTYDGSEVWHEYANFEGYFKSEPAMKSGIRHNGFSNMLKDSKTAASGQKNCMWLGVNTQYIYVIGVYETMGSTLSDFKSYLSEHNLEIVYPLATPITYTLTPQEIRTLLGQNNIWTDTGDTSVTYHADTKLYIDTQATAATFYGLAKAAGDTTQSASSNPVGTYTDEAKSAIKSMLGISEVQTVTVSGTDPVITAVDNTRYVCGEVTSLSFTPCASGICDVIFTSGSTVAVLTLPSTVKMPDGFEVEANVTYEINILDGQWGVYQKWT